MPALLPFTPLDQNCEWIGNRYTFPGTVRDGGEVIQPQVILWLELPSGVLLGATVVNPRSPVSLGETFEEALRNPDEGLPRRPARIRVPDQRMAKELRRAAGSIPIVVAPVPELDDAFAELTEELGGEEPPPTYLGNGETPPAVVRKYFSAAALLFRAAPWRHVQEYQVMRVDIPHFNIDNACLSVIGAGRESLGILLFRSIHDFVAFGRRAVDPGNTGATEEIALRSVSFDRKKDMPPSLIREIEQHRWPVAGSKAYPALICVDEEMSPIQATEGDFRTMTACTQAFLAFFERHRGIFEVEAPGEVCESFTGDDDVTVTITAPYDPEEIASADRALGDLAALGDDGLIEIAPAQAAGRNDPCPCGSGKKYKKCHLEPDERER